MNHSLLGADYLQPFDALLYRVRSGDNLTKILKRYHATTDDKRLQALIHQVQVDNPHLKDPDFIKPDQLVRL